MAAVRAATAIRMEQPTDAIADDTFAFERVRLAADMISEVCPEALADDAECLVDILGNHDERAGHSATAGLVIFGADYPHYELALLLDDLVHFHLPSRPGGP